ncbi:PREDICTED: probable serine/threonine-protein kinase DDB_G0267686 isoform X2 [Vollenhovia emeryi]|uniref:probable serine/threonine-protein kinase DDB_G0267686 isoform X2 n=1 Tax=Vollenhovia emeryi TaxID=411798 RepID=UPI0005F51689|nr:PREDICTED: probable serine/threonine-protein kinase DDB_G0267686 isoform X2 [Vollenhovia emeryi]
MNVGGDIAQLSYKELQALALRYRVPGNIKKKVLVKVLQAAKSGNDAEFYRLQHELRKNRKRKTRKSKDPKLGVTSTPLHSPDYIMADDDYCQQQQQQQQQQQHQPQQHQPQQQSPCQWIGAEEEIASKEDDIKIPHYEEFKQCLFRIQREFQACDSNNNQVEDLSIVDLRTAPMSPDLQTIPLVEPSYPRANLINDTDPLAISSNDRSSYQVLKEPEPGLQGSFLLKRMLQAPVGANLGEIASSIFWTSNLLDNSDTLTAESESNENENELNANTNEYYNLLKNSKGEYLLNEANLMPQQSSAVLADDNQYRYPGDIDNRPNSYQNWTITSVMEVPDSELQFSKVFHAVYYNNTDSTAGSTANADNNLTYQYQTDTACNSGQNAFNLDAQDNYATGTDMVTNDPSDIYYLQNFGRHSGETNTGYFRNVDTFEQNNVQQNVYANDQQYQYLYPRFTQETNNLLNERFEQPQSNFVAGRIVENNINQETGTGNLQRPANGTTEAFWPKWTPEHNNNLENVLNYHVSKQVDYSKLSQTSCVYCYMAPIVSQRSNLAINGCSTERRYTAEHRQHSFSPYWMLYNDTSQGMRMTNAHGNLFEQPMPTHTAVISGNDDLREPANVAPINDVWMNQYGPPSIADDMNIQGSDSLFFNVTADRLDDIPDAPDIAKT